VKRLSVIATSVILLAVLGGRAWGQENLIANPSFEQGEIGKAPLKWGGHGYDGARSDRNFPFAVQEGGHTGERCCVVEVPEGMRWNLIEQYVPVEADLSKGLKLSAWLRSDDPKGKAQLAILVNAPQRQAYDIISVRLDATGLGKDWKRYEAAATLAESVDIVAGEDLRVRAIIQVYAPSRKVCVDDVSFQIISANESQAVFLNTVPKKYAQGLVDKRNEATLVTLSRGRVALYYQKGGRAGYRISRDEGETWERMMPCRLASGKVILTGDCLPVRLPSGALGLVLHASYKLRFTVSRNEGRTWTKPVAINPDGPTGKPFNGSPFVTKSGRIVVPVWHIPPGQKTIALWRQPSRVETICWLSDDEGRTWTRSQGVAVEHDGLALPFEEGVGTQLEDGRLMMLGRTNMARIFKCYSSDNGETWTNPEPTPLVSSYAPCALERMPDGNLLVVWNQSSLDEVKKTFRRHRLTCAVSSDDGMTWEHHRNLESLDDVAKIEDEVNWDVLDMDHELPYAQPTDTTKYPHAPGPLRCAYPAIAFASERAVIVYDYGSAKGIFGGHFLKVRSLPYEWFYENP